MPSGIVFTVDRDISAIYARDFNRRIIAAWKYGPMRSGGCSWVAHRSSYDDRDAAALCDYLNNRVTPLLPFPAFGPPETPYGRDLRI